MMNSATSRPIAACPNSTGARTEDRPVDLVEEGYDLMIRVNPPENQHLIGRRFLRDRLAVAAAPALRRPEPGALMPAALLGTADVSALWTVDPVVNREALSMALGLFMTKLSK